MVIEGMLFATCCSDQPQRTRTF